MLELYLGALGVGGTLLVASLLLGGHHEGEASGFDKDLDLDADVDASGDADADADADGGHTEGIGIGDVLEWLPITSIRFWTFFLAFFGTTGAALTLLGLGGSRGIILGSSVALGYACGLASTAIVKSLRRNQTDSTVRADDVVGASGLVRLGVGKGRPGKIRVELKGRIIELIAYTEDEAAIPVNATVMVYGTTADGDALVTKADADSGARALDKGAN